MLFTFLRNLGDGLPRKRTLIVTLSLVCAFLIVMEKFVKVYSVSDRLALILSNWTAETLPRLQPYAAYIYTAVAGFVSLFIIQAVRFRFSLPSGPSGFPWVGCYFQMSTAEDAVASLRTWATQYGDRFSVHVMGSIGIYVGNAADVAHVLSRGGDVAAGYGYGWGSRSRGRRFPLFGGGVMNSDGPLWRNQRRAVTDMLHPDSLTVCMQAAARRAKSFAEAMRGAEGTEIDLDDKCASFAFDVMAEVLWGSAEEESESAKHNLQEALFELREAEGGDEVLLKGGLIGLLGDLAWWIRGGGQTSRKKIDAHVKKVVLSVAQKDTAALDAQADLLSKFTARKLRLGKQCKGSIKDFNNSLTHAWAPLRPTLAAFLYQMACHPELWRKVTEEVTAQDKAVTGKDKAVTGKDKAVTGKDKAVTGKDKDKDKAVTVAELNGLTFLHYCLLETLRLYPPASLHVREALSDDTLPSGLHVPRGCKVILCPPLLHRDPSLWPDAPSEFKPQRFEQTPLQGSFVPFFGGARRCPGMDLSLLLAKLLVVNLVRQGLLFEPKEGHVMRPIRGAEVTWEGGLPVTVRHYPA